MGVDVGPLKLLVPMHEFFLSGIAGLSLLSREMRALMDSQWATTDEIDIVGEPIHLNFLLPYQPSAFDWVLHKMKEIQHCMGIECKSFEEQFITLLTDIEVGHVWLKKSRSKKQREQKRLTRSINHEGSSSRGRYKGRGPAPSL